MTTEAVQEPTTPLDATLAVIEDGIAHGLHLGAQIYVSIDGEVVSDTALGQARPGQAMTTDSMVTWFSMTKPTVAVAVARCWEAGLLEIDDQVCRHVPEFAANGKEAVTIRHLLTHTGGFRSADQARGSWDEMIAATCAAKLEPGWVPGQRAGYHLAAGMNMLAEIIRRLDGRGFDAYVRQEIFEPLGMVDCWVGMPVDQHARYGDRLGAMFETSGPEPVALDFLDTPRALAACLPGGGGRGPIRQLGLFYEMMLQRGARDGVRIISPQSCEALVARHRVGMYDKTFKVQCDWGLGFFVDSSSMGRHNSPRAFGHGGAQSSVALADPEYGLVAVIQCNGMPGFDRHYARFEAINTALYEDLGLAPRGSPGRARPLPAMGAGPSLFPPSRTTPEG
ncbi:MAG: serine hydrolase domain-containing protein [Acidimicrobiales bacterium]